MIQGGSKTLKNRLGNG